MIYHIEFRISPEADPFFTLTYTDARLADEAYQAFKQRGFNLRRLTVVSHYDLQLEDAISHLNTAVRRVHQL
jgi:hypothetical protein